jgi:F-type H+-transporting ATPase subunit delta
MQGTDPVAFPYADALVEAAKAAGVLAEVRDQVGALLEAFVAAPEGLRVVESPRVPDEAKRKVLERTLRGRVHDVLVNLLLIVVRNGRALHVRGICEEAVRQAETALGRVTATVHVHAPLDAAAERRVREGLAKATGLDVQLVVRVKPDLLGGIRIRVGDRVVDATMRARLQAQRARLLERRLPIEVFA